MPASAYLFPITSRLDWCCAAVPGEVMTTVDPEAPIDVSLYERRDRELAYRDLIVAAALVKVAGKFADIWGFTPAYPVLTSPVSGELDVSNIDASIDPQIPGIVTYVGNQSVPFDALSTDVQLYARDVLLYQAVYTAAAATLGESNPLANAYPTAVTGDAWSFADPREARPPFGYSEPLNPDLFKRPDQHLAWRDNVLASYAARFSQCSRRVWTRANRVLLHVVDDSGLAYEPEVYALLSDDGRFRTWVASPRIPSQLQLTYDRELNTLQWTGERAGTSGSSQYAASSAVIGGSFIERLSRLQESGDSEYFRQKSARLATQFFIDNTIYLTRSPCDFIVSGAVYQVDSVLLTVPSSARLALPIVVPSGCVRVGLSVKPAASFGLLGFQNVEGIADVDATSATLDQAGTLTWLATLPKGRLYYSLTIADSSARTAAFAMRIRYNTDVIFDGSYVYNRAPGESHETQLVEFESTGTPSTFSVEWLGGGGELTIESVNFSVDSSNISANYGLGLQLNEHAARPVTFLGVAERPDVILFDIVVPTELVNPELVIDWIGGGGLVLYVHGYDVKVFDLVEPVANASDYEPYKASLLRQALGSVSQAYRRFTAVNPQHEFRVLQDGEYYWTEDAYGRWIDALTGAGESRLTTAFQLAGPGDLGRPALVPAGLESSAGLEVKARYGLLQAVPRLQALQPWMLAFGARVAGPDFWPLNHPGCTWYGPLETIGVDPDFEISTSSVPITEAHISNLSLYQELPGAPSSSGNRAYTVVNAGPAGGEVSQQLRYVVWLSRLRPGSVYTLTVTVVTALVTDPISAGATSTFAVEFIATSENQPHEPSAITAASGYQVWLQSVVLS